MKIETSITISPDRKKKLIIASKFLGVTVSDLLAALMRKTRSAFRKNDPVLLKAVGYQEKMTVGKYKIWHVSLDPVCYEYGVSERIVFKVSVSRIFGVAIDFFLEEIVKYGLDTKISRDDVATSYKYATYDVEYSENDSNEFWKIIWDRRLKRQKKE